MFCGQNDFDTWKIKKKSWWFGMETVPSVSKIEIKVQAYIRQRTQLDICS